MLQYLITIILSLFFCLPLISFAQEGDTIAYKHYQAGPYVSIGGSIFNGNVPSGSKTGIHFPAFGFGAMGIYSFNPNWGLVLGIGYDSRGMWFEQDSGSQPSENITMNYLSLQPSIKFRQFLLGVNFEIPLGISYSANGTNDVRIFNDAEFVKGYMNTIIDIRAEGMLPLTEKENGSLYLSLSASYCLSNTISIGFHTIGSSHGSPPLLVVFNNPVPMVQIGLLYLFH